ncbi:MAG: rubrerythrin family protein [Methanosarcinales archaeon]|nr:rubrerythrin family protein [Methanosarcinales archaeon]
MTTDDNLKAAFAGESQANRKYIAYAKKADQEGYHHVARLYRAVAEAETVHALNHLRVMDGMRSTDENLKASIEGENAEFQAMYPGFIKEAKAEEAQDAAILSFDLANQVEQIHAGLFKEALENLGSNKEVDYYVCQVCGNTVKNNPPDRCPICKASKDMFNKIE